MPMYATQTAREYRRSIHPAIAIAATDRIFEVYRPLGAAEEHIGYAQGKRDDVQAFYAAQHPGPLELREIKIQTVTPRMAQRAIDQSVERSLRAKPEAETGITGLLN